MNMKSFSERYGYKPIKNVIQLGTMDDDLRNSLWNVIYILFIKGTNHLKLSSNR